MKNKLYNKKLKILAVKQWKRAKQLYLQKM